MTPPDSDDLTGWRCGCGAPISKAQAGCARWPDCVKKPDSDAREVLHSKCERSACTRIVASHGPVLLALWEGEQARDWLDSMVAHPDQGKPYVSLPLPLAQRILAALEGEAANLDILGFHTGAKNLRTIAAELRAVIGK